LCAKEEWQGEAARLADVVKKLKKWDGDKYHNTRVEPDTRTPFYESPKTADC
jgi:hypothetical protein